MTVSLWWKLISRSWSWQYSSVLGKGSSPRGWLGAEQAPQGRGPSISLAELQMRLDSAPRHRLWLSGCPLQGQGLGFLWSVCIHPSTQNILWFCDYDRNEQFGEIKKNIVTIGGEKKNPKPTKQT